METETKKVNPTRLLITLGIVLFTALVIGGSTYYVMSSNAKKEKETADRQTAEMQKQIDDLQQAQEKKTDTTTAAATQDLTANWKTFSSKLFGWSVKYPNSWFTNTDNSESNFTKRGGADVGIDYIGGDTYWSTYDSSVATTPDKVPSNASTMALMVYQETDSMTIQQFVAKKYQNISSTTNFKAGNTDGIQYTLTGNNSGATSYATNVVTIFKKGANFYVVNYGRLQGLDSSFLANYNTLLSTFRFN